MQRTQKPALKKKDYILGGNGGRKLGKLRSRMPKKKQMLTCKRPGKMGTVPHVKTRTYEESNQGKESGTFRI